MAPSPSTTTAKPRWRLSTSLPRVTSTVTGFSMAGLDRLRFVPVHRPNRGAIGKGPPGDRPQKRAARGGPSMSLVPFRTRITRLIRSKARSGRGLPRRDHRLRQARHANRNLIRHSITSLSFVNTGQEMGVEASGFKGCRSGRFVGEGRGARRQRLDVDMVGRQTRPRPRGHGLEATLQMAAEALVVEQRRGEAGLVEA